MATFMIAAALSAGGGIVPALKMASIRCSFQSRVSSIRSPHWTCMAVLDLSTLPSCAGL